MKATSPLIQRYVTSEANSQYNTTNAWYVNLNNAMVNNNTKTNSNRVRAVAGYQNRTESERSDLSP